MTSNVLVRDIMTKNVRVVREDTNLHEVVAILKGFDINALIVVQSEKPVGIITTKDALVRAVEHGMPITAMTAGMVATTPLVTIDEETTIDEAIRLMKRSRIKHLPVINQGKLVGIISDTDILFSVPSMISMMEDICRPKS